MAIDVVAACAASNSSVAPQSYFVTLSIVFSMYIAIDVVIAALVVRRKMKDHQ
jgi:hypothetical protein